MRSARSRARLFALAALAAALACAMPARAVDVSLRAPERYGAVGSPFDVAAGDVTGDGVPDVVAGVAGELGSQATLLKGAGGGLLTYWDYEVSGGSAGFGVDLGDFNGDGRADAAVATGTGVALFLAQTDGRLQSSPPVVTTPGATFPLAVIAADVTGDGRLDVVQANKASGNVTVLKGDGAGNLAWTGSSFAAGAEPFDLALGDVTGDGVRDLVVANLAESSGVPGVSVLAGLGAATPFPPTPVTAAVTGTIQSVAAGDLDGDRYADVVAVDGGRISLMSSVLPAIHVFRGGPGGTLTSAADVDPGAFGIGQSAPIVARLADIDGDGRLDVVSGDAGSPSATVAVLHGNGDATFAAPVRFAIGAAIRIEDLRVADLDGDGARDVVLTTQAGDVVVLRSQGAARAAPAGLDFGPQAAGGSSAPKTVTVTNAAAAPLRIRALALIGSQPGDFHLAGSDCPGATLAPGGACTASVRFAPAAAGAGSAVLEVESAADTSPPQIGLAGTGVAPGGAVAQLRSSVRVPAGQRRATVRRRGLRVAIACSVPCSVQGSVGRAAGKAAAKRPRTRAAFAVARPRTTHALRVRLPAAALAGARRARLVVRATTYAGGERQAVSTTVTLR